MRFETKLQLLLGSFLAGCASNRVGESAGTGLDVIDCGYSEATIDVPSDTVPDLQELLVFLADLYPTPARWWDGTETELFIELDTTAVPAVVPQTTYTYDPATSDANASVDMCPTFQYWAIPFPVIAAGTSDGLLSSKASHVEIVCADNEGNLTPPKEDLPEGLCRLRVRFDLAVDVDPARVPPGDSPPFFAEVVADAPHEGAIIAHIYGSPALDAGGDVVGDTTGSPTSSILSTLTN